MRQLFGQTLQRTDMSGFYFGVSPVNKRIKVVDKTVAIGLVKIYKTEANAFVVSNNTHAYRTCKISETN